MKPERFNEIVEARLKHCSDLLVPKGHEYSRDGDRLHNFKSAATIDGESPMKALWGMWKKHIVSIKDMIDDYERDGTLPTVKQMDDKFADNINYTLLLEGLFMEMLDDTPMTATEAIARRQKMMDDIINEHCNVRKNKLHPEVEKCIDKVYEILVDKEEVLTYEQS